MTTPENSFPCIAIVTAVRNLENYIERTIESVLGQNYPNLQYVIIDGGSSDATQKIVEKYASQLHYFHSRQDNGIYDAINVGFEQTDSDIMGFINGDDLLQPGSLHHVAEQLTQENVEWITGINTQIDVDDQLLNTSPPLFTDRDSYLARCYRTSRGGVRNFGFIQQESTFWRRSLWDATGGQLDTQYQLAGDFDLWMRFFRHATLHVTNQPLGSFRLRPDQASRSNFQDYLDEVEEIRTRELRTLGKRSRLAHQFRLIGRNQLECFFQDAFLRAA